MNKQEIVRHMINSYSWSCIKIETKYTVSYIEKLMPTCKDRGRFKWIAETKYENFDRNNPETNRSLIDNQDLFPRMYFLEDSLCNELFAWLKERNIEITEIRNLK